MDVLRDLLAVDREAALNFFYSNLKKETEKRKAG